MGTLDGKRIYDMNVASFFSGAGGLDLGFKNAGFQIPWANEYDKNIWNTFEANFPKTKLDRRSILDIKPKDVPDVDGFIGGPPCQSFSEAGAKRGVNDPRGRLFFDYMQLVNAKRPKFFLAENVSGLLAKRNAQTLNDILEGFAKLGYNVSYGLLRASNYGIPQDRDRVFIVGYQQQYGKHFLPPAPLAKKSDLRDAILDLKESAVRALDYDPNPNVKFPNHEYFVGGYSPMFMSRNRIRDWREQSFTIQASARQTPLHPMAPKMLNVDKDKFAFVPGLHHMYRRLSIRECARIQTFPDDFIFHYRKVDVGYKQVGNAVPPLFAEAMAKQIKKDLGKTDPVKKSRKKGSITKY